MIRRFKLIKRYPGSESVGSIWYKTKDTDNYWYMNSYLIPEDVETNPEFFEEIIDKDYILWNTPVLSLKDVATIYPGINKEHGSPSHQAELLKKLVKSRL